MMIIRGCLSLLSLLLRNSKWVWFNGFLTTSLFVGVSTIWRNCMKWLRNLICIISVKEEEEEQEEELVLD